MKKLLLLAASMLMSTPSFSDTNSNSQITDSFTDKIIAIKEEASEVVVSFARHAAIYKMPKTNPRYSELLAKLEKLKKQKRLVKVVAIIPIMEIKDVLE